jgi:hypothetical protein
VHDGGGGRRGPLPPQHSRSTSRSTDSQLPA